MRNFRNYDVWVDGVDFSVDIYKLTICLKIVQNQW